MPCLIPHTCLIGVLAYLLSSSDVAYMESMQDPLVCEAGLLQIRQKLTNWSSLLPRCIDTGILGSAIHNNGSSVPTRIYTNQICFTLTQLSTCPPGILCCCGAQFPRADESRHESCEARSPIKSAAILSLGHGRFPSFYLLHAQHIARMHACFLGTA